MVKQYFLEHSKSRRSKKNSAYKTEEKKKDKKDIPWHGGKKLFANIVS